MANEPQGNPGKPKFGPSDSLMAIFRACSRDPTEGIKARLRRMLRTFLQHFKDNAGSETNELAAKCYCEAEMWYYRILENHAVEEKSRLGISDISGIFENDLLQCCLVACCLEIAITVNRLPCDCTLLLQILLLAPYHFWKVIELVLRAEVSLPRAVVTHLAQVEERVLESLAWSGDSPLWEEIRANEGRLPACQQVMLPHQLEDPTRADPQPEGNPPEDHISGAEASGSSTDQPQRSPSAANRPRRLNSLHLFSRRVYSLMGRRLTELSATLQISDDRRLKIWTCFEHSLVKYITLMKDRHLDQLLMCAVYVIAKITNGEIPFKHIMKCYNSQPLACRSVCKNVLISDRRDRSRFGNNSNGAPLTPITPTTHDPGQERRGNLIYFYNNIYTTKIEKFAKQFSPTSGRETPPLSPYPRKASPGRCRLSSRHSIFISRFDAGTTPPSTSGLSYTFNSSPSERLREINNMIRTGRSPSRASNAAVSPDEEGRQEEEDDPPVKRVRLNAQSAWQRRLRDLANDRASGRDQDQDQDQPNQH